MSSDFDVDRFCRILAHEAPDAVIHTDREAIIRFESFRVLLRRRQLLADRIPVELGTRAFGLLLVLLEANGALDTKEGLLDRVRPGIVSRKRTSRFRSPPCAKHSARTVISSVRNSGAATGSLGYCARM